jgi:hypothetical protein
MVPGVEHPVVVAEDELVGEAPPQQDPEDIQELGHGRANISKRK